MERRMTGNCHVRCGAGENSEMISKYYLSLFGTIPDFDKLLATMRSMEISANIIIQNLAQLKKMYDKSWEILTGNCDSLLFLGGQKLINPSYLRKDHYKDQIFEIRTSAVTEIKDFEQQREPCCYAIKTK